MTRSLFGPILGRTEQEAWVAEIRAFLREHFSSEAEAEAFLRDTLAHGVVGGAAYMTPSTMATEAALASAHHAFNGVGLEQLPHRNGGHDLDLLSGSTSAGPASGSGRTAA